MVLAALLHGCAEAPAPGAWTYPPSATPDPAAASGALPSVARDPDPSAGSTVEPGGTPALPVPVPTSRDQVVPSPGMSPNAVTPTVAPGQTATSSPVPGSPSPGATGPGATATPPPASSPGTTAPPTAVPTAPPPTAAPTSPPTVTPTPAPTPSPTPAGTSCQRTTAPETVQVSIQGNAFLPATITVKVGDVVRWTNQDSAPHDAVMLDGSCGTVILRKGESAALRFLTPGTYNYYCTVHPSMRGTVIVTS